MLARDVAGRFEDWTRSEPRVDAWASYGALACAAVASLALLVVGPF